MAPKTQEKLAHFGLVAARVSTLLSPLAIFLALPPFYNGIWVQVEGAMPWLHGIAALAVAGCGLAAWAGHAAAVDSLRHPLVLIPAAVFALSAAFLPFATLPARSLLGAPEHGFGALAYLDLAALTAAALLVVREPRWRAAAVLVALGVIAGAFVLDARYRGERTWAPFFFGDYLGFYAIFAFALLVPYVQDSRARLAAALVGLLGLAALSENKAALLAVVAAAGIVPLIPASASRRTFGIVGVALPILLAAAILLVGASWHTDYRVTLLAEMGSGLGHALSSFWASLWSRAMLVVVALQSLLDAPWRFLTGMGWGHYNEALLANLPIVESRLYERYELAEQSRFYWDALQRSDFHSHNQYAEALLAAGAPGLALAVGYGLAIVPTAPPARRRWALLVFVALTGLQSLWFQMPHTTPVMAIAMAVLTASAPAAAPASTRRWLATGACGAAVILVTAAGLAAIASTQARAALQQIRAGASLPGGGFAAGLGEIYQSAFLQAAYARIKESQSAGTEPDASAFETLRVLLTRASEGDGPASLKLTVSLVNVLSGLIFTIPGHERYLGSLDELHGRSVKLLLSRAPRRTDLAIPYFNGLLARNREREALDMARAILAEHADDAVALWFSGIVLLGDPSTANRGMQQLRQSVARGILNQMPVPAAFLREIQGRRS